MAESGITRKARQALREGQARGLITRKQIVSARALMFRLGSSDSWRIPREAEDLRDRIGLLENFAMVQAWLYLFAQNQATL